MREAGILEARPKAIWADWSIPAADAPPPESHPSPPLGDEEVQRLLQFLVASFGSSGALLTLVPDRGARSPIVVGRGGGAHLSDEAWAQLAHLASSGGGFLHDPFSSGSSSEWISCHLAGSMYNILQIPVVSRRGHSRMVLSIAYSQVAQLEQRLASDKLRQLSPIIEGYLRLWQRNFSQTRAVTGLRSALDGMDVGILLLNFAGAITFVNSSASSMLAKADHVRRVRDTLVATDANDGARLQIAISHALAANARSSGAQRRPAQEPLLALRSPHSERSLIMCIIPCEEAAVAPGDSAAIIYVLDPEIKHEELRSVCRLHGLSPVETRLVCLLSGGACLQEAAKSMGIKEQTARSYLKQIFFKTATSRQADLVRLMLSSLMRTKRDLPLEQMQTTRMVRLLP